MSACLHNTPRGSSAGKTMASDVTVAVATMNRPWQLARCVAAILGGETRPAELVIVDQSADVRTADLVAQAGWNRIVRVTYVRQLQRGLSASRNLAVADAGQPIVAFTDDDCVPDRRWLAAIAAGFAGAERPDVVTGRILPLGPDQPGLYAMSTLTRRARFVYRGRFLPWTVGSGANTAVRRDWLERVGGFDERLGAGSSGESAEDSDLLYRLLRNGATVRYEPDAVVFHERTDAAGRRATSLRYGFGHGAFCGLSARRHDPYAMWMLGGWCAERGRALVGACVRRRWWRVSEELLMLYGATRGIVHGLAVSNSNEVCDSGPEAAVATSRAPLPSISRQSPAAGWPVSFGALRAPGPLCGPTTSARFPVGPHNGPTR
jgi:GT2 family glycosyltransferase